MIESIVKKLRESKEPCRGIFWFVKDDTSEDFDLLFLDIPLSDEITGNSKNGLTYTHEKTWRELASSQSRDIKEKEWNYFPRGRVEIRDMKASIYLNPNVNFKEYQDMIVSAFSLERIPCRFISDGSAHYQCYLDRED